jgi:peptide/nickel transport system permease protein
MSDEPPGDGGVERVEEGADPDVEGADSVDDSGIETALPEYDWSNADGETTFRQWRTRGLVVALAVVAVVAGADHTGRLEIDLLPIEWLTVAAGVITAAYVVVPLAADRSLARYYWRQLRTRPLALASLVYLLGVLVAGVLGPPVIGLPDPELARGYQPPLFTSISVYVAPNCLGAVTDSVCQGSLQYPLGTNGQGQDMILVATLGARVAVEVALVTAAILVPLGIGVGLVAGYRGGVVDEVLMRTVDVQGAVPAFLVYVVLIYVFGRSLLLMVLVFGLLSWGKVARLVRSEVLQRREEDFVMATRAAGASELYVVRNTILPNVSGTVVTAATRQASTLILLEAALSFMGLGEGGAGSWGQAISLGMAGSPLITWWIALWPMLALSLTVVALSVLGDELRDVLDPRTGGSSTGATGHAATGGDGAVAGSAAGGDAAD